jgi:hypothetical protein
VRPEVRDGDDELTLFSSAIRDATAAFEELLSRVANGERLGQPQREKGRLYLLRDRGWRTNATSPNAWVEDCCVVSIWRRA